MRTKMKECVCIFSVKPAVRLSEELGSLVLRFLNHKGFKKVVISKIKEKYGGDLIQTGLEFRVFIRASDIKEARNEAKGLVDGISSFMTLVSGVPFTIPNEQIIYEITPGIKERDFLQIFYDPLKIPVSRRKLDHKLLVDIMDRCFKLDDVSQQIIARAIRWYRLGCTTFEIFDKFGCFWIGLEALNPLLQQKLSVRDDPVKCPKCGHRWVPTPTVSGIREFIKRQLKEKAKLYQKIRQLRINIMHAKTKLEDLRQEAFELTPILCEILFRAICFLIFDKKWREIPFKEPLGYVPIRIEVIGTLIGEDPYKLGPDGQDPHLKPKHTTDGDISFTVTSTFTAHLNDNVKISLHEVRFYGDREIKGRISDIRSNKANDTA